MLSSIDKILIIGLGQLGLPVAKYVKKNGFDTYGYDIKSDALDYAKRKCQIKQTADFGSEDFQVFIVSVSTHQANDISSPEIDGVLTVADKISKEAKRDGALVSIESTVPKGTSKKVFEILNHRLHVVHIPHRWYAREENAHGVNQLRVIGGVCDCCLKVGMQFYGGIENEIYLDAPPNSHGKGLGIPLHPVSNVETSEITKTAENAHRYLQRAFAEELYLYCQANNINFPELRDALNTKWNVEILEPRDGIGGHCLPKDTKMFVESSEGIKSRILTAAMRVDEDYKRYRESRT